MDKPDSRENYIQTVEEFVEKMAKKMGVAIRIERDSRGRYMTLIVRAVGEVAAEPHVVARKVDGVLVKEGK
jgi:predicted RNA-binding protein Jag